MPIRTLRFILPALLLSLGACGDPTDAVTGTARAHVLEPNGTVVAGLVRVRARCEEPGSCRSMKAFVRIGSAEIRIAEGTDSVSTTWSAAKTTVPLKFVFRVTDAAGRSTSVETQEFRVVPGPWTMVVSIAYPLIDASPDWGVFVAEPALIVFDVHTGKGAYGVAESNIHPGIPAVTTAAGALVNFGVSSISVKPNGIREFGGSNAGSLGGSGMRARGRWAAWVGFGPSGGGYYSLHRDDVLAPSLVNAPGWLAVQSFDLAEDGTVAIAGGPYEGGPCCAGAPQLYVWRGGDATQLTFDTAAAVQAPVTDGSAFAYGQLAGGSHRLVYRGADGGEEVLTPWRAGTEPLMYQMMSGWTAFEGPDAAGTWRPFVRAPSGEVHEVWPGHNASLVSLGPDGQVVLLMDDALYLSAPPHSAAVSLGAWGSITRVKWIGGKLYIVKEGSLFRFDGP
ncbi:hypothetical protein [Longimicrobium sp.]|uniref:hypothetical protein n=1 Tax=Longimicrobium sp. TaxID=2029185 RepID=UPI002CAA2B3D|nr:hypothetical protein [Longimicrobium sp.]HSU18083.1 hypothetical protein [Longimicrobium sp.]